MSQKQYTILIIDDSDSDRKIYKRFLNSQQLYSFTILEAGTVATGLNHCNAHEIDCVILDYQLPDYDGLTALAQIREVAQAPVILISGKPEALVMTEAYRRGAAKYLSKDTVTSRAIQEAVNDALNLSY